MPTMSDLGFIKLQRNRVTKELLADRNAFHLLTVIAYRARFSDEPNLEDLRFGEALIGDHDNYGLSRQEERSARARLEKYGLAEFRPVSRGTVASLTDSRIYSLRDERRSPKSNHQFSEEISPKPTNSQPPANHQPTTNQYVQQDRRTESCVAPASPSVAEKTGKPRNLRPRDPLLAALAAVDGSDPAQVTGTAWSGIARALAEIKAVCVDVTEAEIRRRAANYRLHYPNAAITPHALAKHWALADKSPSHRATEPVRLGSNLTDHDSPSP
jgi:hypothetical protein